MYRTIPEGSVEIQPGLWAYLNTFTVGSTTYSNYKLYSAEGYCFWQVSQPENYDEEGNLKPESERVYATYASLARAYTTHEQINADFISVPVQPGYEIVSTPPNHEVM
jgi:hypothetical protein